MSTPKLFFQALTFLLAICFPLFCQGKTPKTLFVIVDGIPADMIERLNVPTIQDIASQGGYHRAYTGGEVGMYSETPTISAIGYTNLLTGTWMNKHNVQGNDNINTNYNYWSLFRIAKEQNRPVKTALFGGWADGSRKLIGMGKPETGNLKIDILLDSIEQDTLAFPRKPLDRNIFDTDSVLAVATAQAIAKEGPDMAWLLMWYTDEIAHHLGNSPQFDHYVELTDQLLAPIWKAVQEREKKYDEDWLVVITTDHGRIECGLWHGKQSERERTTWISTNKKPNSHFCSDGLAIVDINPTVCRHMGFEVPDNVLWEQDGIPFIGPIDISDLKTHPYEDDKVTLTWTVENPDAQVEIYGAPSNNIANGEPDQWVKLGEVKASEASYLVDLNRLPHSSFYKFAAVTPNNHLTRWLLLYAHS